MRSHESFIGTPERGQRQEDSLESRLESVTSRQEVVEKGVNWALDELDRKFGLNGERPLEYHNRQHSERGVTEAAQEIYAKIVGEDDIHTGDLELIRIAGAFHDLEQFFENGKRITDGTAERASAAAARTYMEAANAALRAKGLDEAFSEEDIQQVEEAILATRVVMEDVGFIQPGLYQARSSIARAVALADLNAVGNVGAPKFVEEGNALFREEHRNLVDAFADPHLMSPEDRESYRGEMLNWLQIQIEFAEKRKNNFEIELADPSLGNDARARLREYFNTFDESIDRAKERTEFITVERKRKPIAEATLEQLARDMGIEVRESDEAE